MKNIASKLLSILCSIPAIILEILLYILSAIFISIIFIIGVIFISTGSICYCISKITEFISNKCDIFMREYYIKFLENLAIYLKKWADYFKNKKNSITKNTNEE